MRKLLLPLATSGNTLTANNLSVSGMPFAAAIATVYSMFWNVSTTSYIQLNAFLAAAASDLTVRGTTAAGTNAIATQVANAVLHATSGGQNWMEGRYFL